MKRAFVTKFAFFLVSVFTLCAVSLTSCAFNANETAEILNSAFSAEIRVTHGDVTVCATLVASALSKENARELTLSFTYPESVSGMTLERKGTESTLSLNGFSLSLNSDAPILSFLSEILTVTGGTALIGNAELDGTPVIHLRADGDTELYFKKDGKPFFASQGETKLEILSFEKSE